MNRRSHFDYNRDQTTCYLAGGTMDAQQTEAFAQDWIQAWNQRDLEAVLSRYTEDVNSSPLWWSNF